MAARRRLRFWIPWRGLRHQRPVVGRVRLAAPLVSVAVAAPLAVSISVIVAAVIIAQDWRKIEVRSAAWLFAASLPGIPLGLWLLATASDHVVKLLLGVLITLFSLYSLAFKSRLHLEKDHPAWLLGAGFFSGFLGGAYGINGPPLAVYGSLRRWSPQHFRATLQGYFLPASLLGLAGYAYLGLWSADVTRYFLLSLPAVIVAILIGRFLNQRLHGDAFFRLVFLGLIALGVILFIQGLNS